MMMVQSEVMAMPGSGFGEGFELDSPDFWFFFLKRRNTLRWAISASAYS